MSTTTAIPGDRIIQRQLALEKANEVRQLRAVLKREMKAGKVTVREVLEDIPSYAEGMTVTELLLARPRLGRVKVARFLSRRTIAASRPIGALTMRQRAEITAALG